MDKILKIVFIVLAVLVVVGALFLGGALVGSQWFSRASAANFVPAPAISNGSGQQPGNAGGTQGQTVPGGNSGQGNRFGPGMMNGGQGQSGSQRGSMGMRPGTGNAQANLTPVTVDEARTAAQSFLSILNLDGLQIGDVTVVGDSAYVSVTETATDNGAFQLVVDPFSKTAYPVQGPATLWNLKYGGVLQANLPPGRSRMMGHLNNSGSITPTPAATVSTPVVTPANITADMPITSPQAVQAAQAYLAQTIPGATAATTPLKFYGYFSLSYSVDGNVAGLLSINGYNGEVLPALQHGMNFAVPN